MKIECYELNKLKSYLDSHKIKYVIKSDPETAHYRIERIHFNKCIIAFNITRKRVKATIIFEVGGADE